MTKKFLKLTHSFIDTNNPIIEFSSGCHNFIIFYDKQVIQDGVTNNGKIKIVGLYNNEDESDLVKFTAVVMGREFKPEAKEQLLFDI